MYFHRPLWLHFESSPVCQYIAMNVLTVDLQDSDKDINRFPKYPNSTICYIWIVVSIVSSFCNFIQARNKFILFDFCFQQASGTNFVFVDWFAISPCLGGLFSPLTVQISQFHEATVGLPPLGGLPILSAPLFSLVSGINLFKVCIALVFWAYTGLFRINSE